MSLEFNPQKYIRTEAFPSIWCSGCGHGAVLNGLLSGIHRAEISMDDLIAVGGIGCSGRAAGLMDCDGMMTSHGRPLAFATGMKMTHPEKNFLILTGDGDSGAIGGNHFIHAARRNIDLTVLLMNNNIYGMTGGQVSPTTPLGAWSTTTTLGNLEPPADMCGLAITAGASFVARSTAYHVNQIASLVAKGFANQGLSVIEVISPCPTGFGRKNRFSSAVDMFKHLKEVALPVARSRDLSPQELQDRIVTGVLHHEPRPEYSQEYRQLISMAAEAKSTEQDNLPRLNGANPGGAQIRLSGSGGQGLVLGGIMLAEAAIMVGKRAVNSQAYGPEARGGAARAEVIVDDKAINHIQVTSPDFLVCLTQESADRFAGGMAPDGLLVLDTTLVEKPPTVTGKRVLAPLTEIAMSQLGNALVANTIALGILARHSGLITLEALNETVKRRVPSKVLDVNLKALETGWSRAHEWLEENNG